MYQLWATLQEKFGDFFVALPVSVGRNAFLNRVRNDDFKHHPIDG